MPHGLDTDKRICFYEQEFYVFSNFSSFQLVWRDTLFPTSEHAYQHEKFVTTNPMFWPFSGPGKYPYTDFVSQSLDWLRYSIENAMSAHEAFKLAERNKAYMRPDWNIVKTKIMKLILISKVHQHEYVMKKLLESGDRELVENSWRDSYWGWGEDKKGKNMLGKLWMDIRKELREKIKDTTKK